jgi:hypothetical protein
LLLLWLMLEQPEGVNTALGWSVRHTGKLAFAALKSLELSNRCR